MSSIQAPQAVFLIRSGLGAIGNSWRGRQHLQRGDVRRRGRLLRNAQRLDRRFRGSADVGERNDQGGAPGGGPPPGGAELSSIMSSFVPITALYHFDQFGAIGLISAAGFAPVLSRAEKRVQYRRDRRSHGRARDRWRGGLRPTIIGACRSTSKAVVDRHGAQRWRRPRNYRHSRDRPLGGNLEDAVRPLGAFRRRALSFLRLAARRSRSGIGRGRTRADPASRSRQKAQRHSALSRGLPIGSADAGFGASDTLGTRNPRRRWRARSTNIVMKVRCSECSSAARIACGLSGRLRCARRAGGAGPPS